MKSGKRKMVNVKCKIKNLKSTADAKASSSVSYFAF
jgi:hypothetical protein